MPKVGICPTNFFVRQQIMLRYLKSIYYLSAYKLSIPEKQDKHNYAPQTASDERARGDLPRKSLCAAQSQAAIPDVYIIYYQL